MQPKKGVEPYGTSPDNPTKAPPRKAAVADSAVQVSGAEGGQEGAGTGMKKGS